MDEVYDRRAIGEGGGERLRMHGPGGERKVVQRMHSELKTIRKL